MLRQDRRRQPRAPSRCQSVHHLFDEKQPIDFLFIHGNYPAQFRHLAPRLGESGEHRVVFLTAREDACNEAIPGVEIYQFSCHRKPHPETHHYNLPKKQCFRVKQYSEK